VAKTAVLAMADTFQPPFWPEISPGSLPSRLKLASQFRSLFPMMNKKSKRKYIQWLSLEIICALVILAVTLFLIAIN
jgi:hypothetical protein